MRFPLRHVGGAGSQAGNFGNPVQPIVPPKAVNAPNLINFTGVPEGMQGNPYYGEGLAGINEARDQLATTASGFPLSQVKEPFGGIAHLIDKFGTNLRGGMAQRAEAATREQLASIMGGIDLAAGPTQEQIQAAYEADPAFGEKLYAQAVAAQNAEQWTELPDGRQQNKKTGEIKDAGTAHGAGALKESDVASLADDFTNTPDVKNFQNAQSMWTSMQDAATRDTAQADLNMVIATAKLFDPTSVVRTEEGRAVELTGDLPSSVSGAFAYLTGKKGARLSRTVRQGMLQEGYSRMNGYYRGVQQASDWFRQKAARRGYNPDDIIRPFAAPQPFDPEKVVGSTVTEDTTAEQPAPDTTAGTLPYPDMPDNWPADQGYPDAAWWKSATAAEQQEAVADIQRILAGGAKPKPPAAGATK